MYVRLIHVIKSLAKQCASFQFKRNAYCCCKQTSTTVTTAICTHAHMRIFICVMYMQLYKLHCDQQCDNITTTTTNDII